MWQPARLVGQNKFFFSSSLNTCCRKDSAVVGTTCDWAELVNGALIIDEHGAAAGLVIAK